MASPYGKAAANITIELGLVQIPGKMYNVARAEEKSEVHSVCPTCKNPKEFMGSGLYCKDNPAHGPFGPSQVRKGVLNDAGKITILDLEKLDEARTSELPDRRLVLQVHERAEVEQHTVKNGQAYVFRTDLDMAGAVLIHLLETRPDLCFVSKTQLFKRDHLVMVDLELNGQIVIRDLVWPEDMKEFAAPTTELDERQAELGVALMESLLVPFDVDEYKAEARLRVQELTGANAAPATPKRKAAVAASDALTNVLEAAIAQQKPSRKRKAS